MVCIIDDREDVWNFTPSMIHVKPYNFFEGTADINAPPGLDKGDTEKVEDGQKKTGKKHRVNVIKVPKKMKKESVDGGGGIVQVTENEKCGGTPGGENKVEDNGERGAKVEGDENMEESEKVEGGEDVKEGGV